MIPIPINDHIRRRIFWTSTLLLIIFNTIAFGYELSLGPYLNRFITNYAVVPILFTSPRGFALIGLTGAMERVFASMFLHAGWLHLFGNMLFLFVFGRSIEDRFNHGQFLGIYFASGLVATFAQIYFNPSSRLPAIGASGAIAGILGAYFVCFPGARITTLIYVLFFFWRVEIPAVFMLGYWFVIQFAAASIERADIQSATHGGTAWWAHVGGFIAGALLALVLPPRRMKAEVLPPY